MRLLIVTQAMDVNNPVLGFFVRWVEEFAKRFDKVTVICLEKGDFDLPANVSVYSLGKEKFGKLNIENSLDVDDWRLNISRRIRYALSFYYLIWKMRRDYSAVFVHMNQGYVLLGGLFWRLFGKRVYMWRNHAKGNLFTRIAVLLSNKVFCTSPQSYTARFKKTKIMPVGIDTDFFKPDLSVVRIPNSILFLGRIAPVKKVLEFVEWFNSLEEKFTATVAGSALPKDSEYEKLVRSRASERIKFIGAVTQAEARTLYQSHETYVNMTPAGSMDKTILEAAACEMAVKVENDDLKILESKSVKELRDFVIENHSLKVLMDKLKIEL